MSWKLIVAGVFGAVGVVLGLLVMSSVFLWFALSGTALDMGQPLFFAKGACVAWAALLVSFVAYAAHMREVRRFPFDVFPIGTVYELPGYMFRYWKKVDQRSAVVVVQKENGDFEELGLGLPAFVDKEELVTPIFIPMASRGGSPQ